MSFPVKFKTDPAFTASFASETSKKVDFGNYIVVPVADYYDGSYEVTPSAEVQTIPIVGKTARQNITVGAIPNNYGLITWNGSNLTVS